MFNASREFVILSVDGFRVVEDRLEAGQPATALSQLDHYMARPVLPPFDNMSLLQFVQKFFMPKELQAELSLTCRSKAVIVIVRPHYSPDCQGPQYEQYCRQRLVLHMPFHTWQEVLGAFNTAVEACRHYLHSGSIPSSLEEDLHRLDQEQQHQCKDSDHKDGDNHSNEPPTLTRDTDNWMMLCQLTSRAALGN